MTKIFTGTSTPIFQHTTGTFKHIHMIRVVPLMTKNPDTTTHAAIAAKETKCITTFFFFTLFYSCFQLVLSNATGRCLPLTKAYSLCLLLLTVKMDAI